LPRGAMSLERMPTLGTKPVGLTVECPVRKPIEADSLGKGLRELYRRGEFTDVKLLCAEQIFLAHRVVLAAESDVFKEGLTVAPVVAQRQEVRLADIANPEAVKIMLDYIYQMDTDMLESYNPKTQDINKDVLRLAQNFKLPGLTDFATVFLTKELNTGNVVERLAICEDFDLCELRERILEQLTLNKRALAEVAHSPQIMRYPRLMQALLQQAAGVPDFAQEPAHDERQERQAREAERSAAIKEQAAVEKLAEKLPAAAERPSVGPAAKKKLRKN